MLWLLVLLACGAPCVSTDGCARCDAPADRDLCHYDQLVALPIDQSDAARAAASSIADPVVRGAAIALWLERAGPSLSRPEQESLCALLDGSVRRACERRAASPHLQR